MTCTQYPKNRCEDDYTTFDKLSCSQAGFPFNCYGYTINLYLSKNNCAICQNNGFNMSNSDKEICNSQNLESYLTHNLNNGPKMENDDSTNISTFNNQISSNKIDKLDKLKEYELDSLNNAMIKSNNTSKHSTNNTLINLDKIDLDVIKTEDVLSQNTSYDS